MKTALLIVEALLMIIVFSLIAVIYEKISHKQGLVVFICADLLISIRFSIKLHIINSK
jgi:hypothetical protein